MSARVTRSWSGSLTGWAATPYTFLQTVKALTDRRVNLVAITDGIDSLTPAGRMVIGLLASMTEFERELIKERTALKRQASRANGTKFGRPRKVSDSDNIATARRMRAPHRPGRRQVPWCFPRDLVQVPQLARRCLEATSSATQRIWYHITPAHLQKLEVTIFGSGGPWVEGHVSIQSAKFSSSLLRLR